MLDTCHIIFPDPNNIAIPLLHTEGKEKGKPCTAYLFKNHCRVTALEAAQSCEYYAKYITFPAKNGTTETFSLELAWTYSHFQPHVEANLYESVNKEFLCLKDTQQGGPLFLKLLLDKLVVNNDSNLENLISTTTNYNIKVHSDSEDIDLVVSLLQGVTTTIIALCDDQEYPLPEKFVQKMLKVFQTSSVPSFNDSFEI